MIQIISHRGYLTGVEGYKYGVDGIVEPTLDEILEVLNTTNFGVEVDLRLCEDYAWDIDTWIVIGHDESSPTDILSVADERVQILLNHPNALLHAKTKDMYTYLYKNYYQSEIFDHSDEAWAFTSRERRIVHFNCIWRDAIWNQPEKWFNIDDWQYRFSEVLRMARKIDSLPSAILTKYPYRVQFLLRELDLV